MYPPHMHVHPPPPPTHPHPGLFHECAHFSSERIALLLIQGIPVVKSTVTKHVFVRRDELLVKDLLEVVARRQHLGSVWKPHFYPLRANTFYL